MSVEDVPMRRLLSLPDLEAKGVSYSRAHIDRLREAQRFPAPIILGENRNAWVEEEIDQWIEARIAERDSARAEAA